MIFILDIIKLHLFTAVLNAGDPLRPFYYITKRLVVGDIKVRITILEEIKVTQYPYYVLILVLYCLFFYNLFLPGCFQ